MKFGKPTYDDGEPIQMAPLIDIVFLTLVFFMITSVYSTLETELDINLPTAQSGVSNDRLQGEIFVNLKKDGTIILNEKVVDLEELQGILNRVAEHFPGGTVIIRGDRDANLGNALAILDCCKIADIQSVAFATLPKEEAGADG
ncbi:MAG: biopolymer transporter ExbD [Candidatus Hydrogenedentota bacterium]